ncbi:calcium-binding protein, partial [uncultured Ramlibacter sp.]|uniref:calcium-binding protein n=1 Tax=uncultured Ramlibacter sp. TaxID=260755 RepID=UPI002622B323
AAGDDLLEGGAGKDTLSGAGGADQMIGGDGVDLYYVKDAGDTVVETESNKAIGGIDAVYSYLDDYTLTNDVENGSIKLAGGARLVGNGLANSLKGGAGDDTLEGGAGKDTLSGAGGSDQMVGGDGSDLYYVGAGDTVVESEANKAIGGSDTVYSYLDNYSLTANVEDGYIKQTDGARLEGNGLNNTLKGGAGADTLVGGDGADALYGETIDGVFDYISVDRMEGGNGSDRYYVDDMRDVVVETEADQAVGGTDTVYLLTGQFTLGANVENGYVTDGGGALYGNGLDNRLTGGAGYDILTGKGGNDTLVGGDGNDELSGNAGNDTMTGGLGADGFFFFNEGSGFADVITDFDGGQGDIIYVPWSSGVNYNSTVEHALTTATDEAGGVRLDMGNGNSVLLVGVSAASLQWDFFHHD